ncbi:hypothetical protein ACVW16_004112 [Bradyrhizobium sp. USDA 4474]
MNAGVAKLIQQDLVYSTRAPNVAHVRTEQVMLKSSMIAQPNGFFGVARCFATHNHSSALSDRTFADECEWPPYRRIRMARRGGVINIRQHRAPKSFGSPDFWFVFEQIESRGGQAGGSFRIHCPMRNQQRTCAGVEEATRQSRQRLGARLVAGNRVAGRQHHPICIELELRDLTRREQTVVELGRLIWNRKRRDGSPTPLTPPATSPWVAK